MNAIKKSKGIGRRADLIFYSILLIWPILQFSVFYVYVNFNSFFLAFKDIELVVNPNGTSGYVYSFSLSAFSQLWKELGSQTIRQAGLVSLLTYALSLVVTMPLGLIFSFYISKKRFGSGFFRVMLFLPSILSSMVTVTLYKNFVDLAIPNMISDVFNAGKVTSILSRSAAWKFFAIYMYNLLVGFGVSVLMYSNAMSGIAPEITEAAQLDGATGMKEFIYISLPSVFSTVSVFIVTGIAGIFTNQFNLFSFYGTMSTVPFQTFGYYLYTETYRWQNDMSHYPYLSALGLAMTAVAVPSTFIVRRLLEKFGPSPD